MNYKKHPPLTTFNGWTESVDDQLQWYDMTGMQTCKSPTLMVQSLQFQSHGSIGYPCQQQLRNVGSSSQCLMSLSFDHKKCFKPDTVRDLVFLRSLNNCGVKTELNIFMDWQQRGLVWKKHVPKYLGETDTRIVKKKSSQGIACCAASQYESETAHQYYLLTSVNKSNLWYIDISERNTSVNTCLRQEIFLQLIHSHSCRECTHSCQRAVAEPDILVLLVSGSMLISHRIYQEQNKGKLNNNRMDSLVIHNFS